VHNSYYDPKYFLIGALNTDLTPKFMKKYEGFTAAEEKYLAYSESLSSSIEEVGDKIVFIGIYYNTKFGTIGVYDTVTEQIVLK